QRVECTGVHVYQPSAAVREGARDDDGHGVVHEGLPHLVFDGDGNSVALAAGGVHAGLLRGWFPWGATPRAPRSSSLTSTPSERRHPQTSSDVEVLHAQ